MGAKKLEQLSSGLLLSEWLDFLQMNIHACELYRTKPIWVVLIVVVRVNNLLHLVVPPLFALRCSEGTGAHPRVEYAAPW